MAQAVTSVGNRTISLACVMARASPPDPKSLPHPVAILQKVPSLTHSALQQASPIILVEMSSNLTTPSTAT